MVNISRKFMQQLYNDQRNYLVRVEINLADTNHTVLTLTNENIWDFSPTIDDAVSSDEDLQVGTAIINKFSFTINNIYETYSQYDFKDAKVFLTVGLDIGNDTVERIKKGTFYVDTADYNDTFITLECLDGMHKFEKPFKANTIAFPATAGYIVSSICTTCGVILDTTSFPNKDYIITSAPDKDTCTYREVLSWIAQICGCFARFNSNGNLELKWYDRTSLETVIDGLDGGVFDVTTLSSYQTGDTVNGGSFNPWNTGDVYDSGDFTDMIKNVHFINTAYSHTMSVDDVVITGVRILVKTKDVVDSETGAVTNTDVISTHFQGTEGYIIEISENPFITEENVNVIISYLGTQLIGLRFRKANLSVPSDPSIEAGDVAIYWDRKGIYHPILVSRTTFITGEAQTIVSSAQTPARNSAERYSAETKNYVAVRKQIREEKNARQLMFDDFQEQMAHANGMYCTEVEDEETHAVTTYYHNKPLLEESDIQIVISDVGISVTNTGTAQTPTWYGLKVDGDFIAHILAAKGINADWINAGTLIIKDANNNETLFADTQTGEVRINASTVKIGGTEFNQKVQQIIEANDFDTDNLLIDSTGFSSDYWETSGTVDTGQTDPYGGTDAIRITPTSSTQGYIRANRTSNNPYKTTGAWYRFSVWLKASSSSSGAITLYLNNEAYSVTPTTEWKQYWFDKEVTSVSSSNNLASIGGESSFTTSDGCSLYVYNPRVFYTSKPETMREMFNRLTGNSQNQGLYIGTDSQGVDRAFVNLTYAKTGALSVISNGNEILHVDAEDGSLAWASTNSSMTKDGTLTCNNARITGVITAGSGSQIGEMKAGIFSNVPCFYSGNRTNYNVDEEGICIESNGNFGLSGNAVFWSSPGALSTTFTTELQMLEWTNGAINGGIGGEDFVLRLSHGSDTSNQQASFIADAVTGDVTVGGALITNRIAPASGMLTITGDEFVSSNIYGGAKRHFNSRDKSGYTIESVGSIGGGNGTEYGTSAGWWELYNSGNIKGSGEIVSEKRITQNTIQGYVSVGQYHSNVLTNNAICVWRDLEKFVVRWNGSATFIRSDTTYETGIGTLCYGIVDINQDSPSTSTNSALVIYRQVGNTKTRYFYVQYNGYIFYMTSSHDSDERYKNIKGSYDHKDLFMKIKPIEFTWKKDFIDEECTHLGVGAQTLKKQAEECGCKDLCLVNYNKENDRYSVNYTELFMLAVPVIQEHEKKIMKLEAENKALKKQINDLETRLARLEAIINRKEGEFKK